MLVPKSVARRGSIGSMTRIEMPLFALASARKKDRFAHRRYRRRQAGQVDAGVATAAAQFTVAPESRTTLPHLSNSLFR